MGFGIAQLFTRVRVRRPPLEAEELSWAVLWVTMVDLEERNQEQVTSAAFLSDLSAS